MKKFIFFVTSFIILQQSLKAQQRVELFPLSAVKLEDQLFSKAQQNNLKYILELSPDRLLAPFLIEAGLQPKGSIYGNWESSGLAGQTAGHYLSSLAMMYAATGQTELKTRLDYMVAELDRCQQKNGNGYVGGVPGGLAMWADVAKGKIEVSNFSLNKKWVPWYNMHKLYAGLIDAWLITNSEKAKQILVKLADWCWKTTSNLSDEQMQEMLKCEQGGMNEVLAEVAAIAGDKKYLKLAERFSHQFILQPLLHNKDELTGLHANTQIPKVIGFLRIGELEHNQAWQNAASFFWETVVTNRSISIGGNSVREHFNKTDDFSQMMCYKEGPETCNSYNMLKLSKYLFQEHPKTKYIDYYEKTTYNHILSSQHPKDGGLVYLTPLRPQHYRTYSQPQTSFWCCVGTGIENHAKYGELIYAHTKDDLYVNLFIQSSLSWKQKNLVLKQETRFPFEETTSLKLSLVSPKIFSINIRKPKWVKNGLMEIRINKKPLHLKPNNEGYYVLKKEWKSGDEITCFMRMETTTEALPDNSSWISFVHGPIVLAAATSTNDLNGLKADEDRKAHIANGPIYPVSDAPVIIADSNNFKPVLENINEKELVFGLSKYIYQQKYKELQLIPFFELHDARYMIYWPVSSLSKVAENQKKWIEQEQRILPLEIATIDFVAPGEQQSEVDHNFDGENTDSGIIKDRRWRASDKWFSYDLNNKTKNAKKLRITFFGADESKKVDIFINDTLLQRVLLPSDKGEKFFDEEYIIPEQLTSASSLKIKFAGNNYAGAKIFYVRLLK
ncbi:MAG TPA: glycoside hydrolase family 127 protein [Pelobium sp.]